MKINVEDMEILQKLVDKINVEDMEILQKLVDAAWHFASVTNQIEEEKKLHAIAEKLDVKIDKAEKK